jgi:hypothetical protein
MLSRVERTSKVPPVPADVEPKRDGGARALGSVETDAEKVSNGS